jgi:hypothetical protein
MWAGAPGSIRELESLSVREMDFLRRRLLAPPDCHRVHGSRTDRRRPPAEITREQLEFFRVDWVGVLHYKFLKTRKGLMGMAAADLSTNVEWAAVAVQLLMVLT